MLAEIYTDKGNLIEVELDYSYTPGRPGVLTLPNGDPGYPDEPPDYDYTIKKIKVRKNWIKWEKLSEKVKEKIYSWLKDANIEEKIDENVEDEHEAWLAEKGEREREERICGDYDV